MTSGPAPRAGARLESIVRREYPDPGPGIFLNSASWGLLPKSSAEAAADLTLRRNRNHGFEESELGAIQRRCRSAIARLIGGNAGEIALSPNTSFGVNLGAGLLRAGRPGTIVVSEGEFPANVLPFLALEDEGFTVRIVPYGPDGLPDEDALIQWAEAPDVVAVAVSAVQFATGHRSDLSRIGSACRDRHVLFFVDAIQQVGVAPIDVQAMDADLVACGGQKWLCAPWGSGFTWIRSEVQERFPPPMVSWLATATGADFSDMLQYSMTWRSNARKFELATLGVQDYLGLARSVEILEEIGVADIRAHVLALHDVLIDWVDRSAAVLVSPRDPDRRAGIITIGMDAVSEAAGALRERGVVCSVREGALRFAPHFYNTRDDIDAVIEILDAID